MENETLNKNIFSKQLSLLSKLGFEGTGRLMVKYLLSLDHYYILYLNLSSLNRHQMERFNYVLHPAEKDDFKALTAQVRDYNTRDRKEILTRILFYQAGLKNCYIAKTDEGQMAYMQWIVYPHENKLLARAFPRRFYPLKSNQVMVKNRITKLQWFIYGRGN
jgi:hypothetical protein